MTRKEQTIGNEVISYRCVWLRPTELSCSAKISFSSLFPVDSISDSKFSLKRYRFFFKKPSALYTTCAINFVHTTVFSETRMPFRSMLSSGWSRAQVDQPSSTRYVEGWLRFSRYTSMHCIIGWCHVVGCRCQLAHGIWCPVMHERFWNKR